AALARLARLNGLQTSYFNVDRARVPARPESLLAILGAYGVPLSSPAGAPDAIREHLARTWDHQAEPVLVAWDGKPDPLPLRAPKNARGRIEWQLKLEDGTAMQSRAHLEALPVAIETGEAIEYHLRIGDLPQGYHRLRVWGAGFDTETLVISAPTRAYLFPGPPKWGIFLPLYDLRTRDSWGAGDYSDLHALAGWLQARGGDIVATLPLGPAFLDGPRYLPSPYSPVSRLAWNEFFVDPRRA